MLLFLFNTSHAINIKKMQTKSTSKCHCSFVSSVELVVHNLDDIIGNGHAHTHNGPQHDQDEEEQVAKRGLVFVLVNAAQSLLHDIFAGKCQSCRDDVLHPNAREGTCDAHQNLDVLSSTCNGQRRDQGQKREQDPVQCPVKGLLPSPSLENLQEESLEVFSECDGYDGEVRAESEDREEGQVVAQNC